MLQSAANFARDSGLVGALLCLCACSSGGTSSVFQNGDASVAGDTSSHDAPGGYDEVICDQPPGIVYCSATKGPVASLDAGGAGVVVQCPAEYPSCEPPGFGGPAWTCCLNCENPPLATCMLPLDAGTGEPTDSGGTDDGG